MTVGGMGFIPERLLMMMMMMMTDCYQPIKSCSEIDLTKTNRLGLRPFFAALAAPKLVPRLQPRLNLFPFLPPPSFFWLGCVLFSTLFSCIQLSALLFPATPYSFCTARAVTGTSVDEGKGEVTPVTRLEAPRRREPLESQLNHHKCCDGCRPKPLTSSLAPLDPPASPALSPPLLHPTLSMSRTALAQGTL